MPIVAYISITEISPHLQ